MYKSNLVKKIISTSIIVLILWAFYVPNTHSYNAKDYFVVTAYYSPLPDQNFYLTGDYNDEKRLNWQWIRWASWKPVFSWMLAAPKNYAFWTKIELDWLWIWVVEDRWWAIVNAWNRWYESDRIDVWMWYWDEWLRRALYWGKRKIKWRIVSNNTKPTLDYNNIASPMWATKGLNIIPSIFNESIGKSTSIETIKKLQNFLTKTWLYKWKINWVYNKEIISLVYDFQIENKIVSSESSSWAWYWGNLTRKTFLKQYLDWEFDKKLVDLDEIELKNNISEIVEKTNKYKSVFNNPVKTKEEIINLQNLLIEMWLYVWKANGSYDPIRYIVMEFQLKNKLINTKLSTWAWYYWPNTRKVLKDEYRKFLELNNRKEELEKQFWDLEKIANKEAKKELSAIWKPRFWEISSRVRSMQKLFWLLWYFKSKDTAIFWEKTKESIVKFQLENNIIDSKADTWAWVIWPKTTEILEKELTKKILIEKVEESSLDQKMLLKIWVYKA